MKCFRKPVRNKDTEEIYERCVICQEELNVLRNSPVEERFLYVEGCGQLCVDCYRRISDDPAMQITDASMEYLMKRCRKAYQQDNDCE